MKRIYLDYAATTPTHPEVVREMQPYFEQKFGNPSSIHSFGQVEADGMQSANATGPSVARIISPMLTCEAFLANTYPPEGPLTVLTNFALLSFERSCSRYAKGILCLLETSAAVIGSPFP